jgi:hypothetical protein
MKPFLTNTAAGVKPNLDIPSAVAPIVNRVFETAITSKNEAGGTVPIAFLPAGPGERGPGGR